LTLICCGFGGVLVVVMVCVAFEGVIETLEEAIWIWIFPSGEYASQSQTSCAEEMAISCVGVEMEIGGGGESFWSAFEGEYGCGSSCA